MNLSNSCLNADSAIKILQAMILKNIRVLDFSLNPALSERFYETLAGLFDEEHRKLDLAVLKLNSNKMRDKNCTILCSKIAQSGSLRVLDLTNNQLTDKAMYSICQVITNCPATEELHLGYN